MTGVAGCVLSNLVVPLVNAEETPRLTGDIGLGVVVIEGANNMSPGGSSDIIDDLYHAPKKETFVAPLIIPTLIYDIGEVGGSSLFFNADPPIDEAGSLGINTGLSQKIDDIGILEYSIFFSPFAEAYKNPYLTGVKRETTSAIEYGGKIAFNRILGSGFRINVAWMKDDIDDDQIGEDTPELARNGNIYSLNTNYSFYLSEDFEIRPKLGVRLGDFDGDANSYVKIKPGVEIAYTIGHLTIAPELFYSSSKYDEINPIFDKTREDKGYGINLALHYAAPFGFENYSLLGFLGYSRDDSNINFYDTEATTAGIMFTYDFAY